MPQDELRQTPITRTSEPQAHTPEPTAGFIEAAANHTPMFDAPDTAALGGAPQTCSPPGPPYDPICSESYYYYPQGNLIQAVPDAATMITGSPGKHVARLSTGGTAVLIDSTLQWLITAAHCVIKDGHLKSDGLSVSLAQWGINCRPYGAVPVVEAHVPKEWFDNPGGSYDSPKTRAYDWALLKVRGLARLRLPEAPAPKPMTLGSPAVKVDGVTAFTMGYGCGKSASGSTRQAERPYTTHLAKQHGTIIKRTDYPVTGHLKGGGGVVRSTLEATGGFSGGPLWVKRGKANHLVGVMVGSPQAVCETDEIWAAAMTPTTLSRILAVVGGGTPANMKKFGYTRFATLPPTCTTWP